MDIFWALFIHKGIFGHMLLIRTLSIYFICLGIFEHILSVWTLLRILYLYEHFWTYFVHMNTTGHILSTQILLAYFCPCGQFWHFGADYVRISTSGNILPERAPIIIFYLYRYCRLLFVGYFRTYFWHLPYFVRTFIFGLILLIWKLLNIFCPYDTFGSYFVHTALLCIFCLTGQTLPFSSKLS